MENQVAAGLIVLDGSVRVRTPGGLVRLDELGATLTCLLTTTKARWTFCWLLRTTSYRQQPGVALKCGILPTTWSDVSKQGLALR